MALSGKPSLWWERRLPAGPSCRHGVCHRQPARLQRYASETSRLQRYAGETPAIPVDTMRTPGATVDGETPVFPEGYEELL